MPPRRKPADDGAGTGPLAQYRAKRDFAKTTEPRGALDATGPASEGTLSFVVQKHAATQLHYDIRLELDGILLSWAVPKGPSFDPADKHIAIRVEDHPIEYGSFEGTIPKGEYGAGEIIVWDRGSWEPASDPRQGLAEGKLVFTLHGQKLHGMWELVRIAKPGDKQDPWMLFKKRDSHARSRKQYDVLSALPDSVIGKPLKAQSSTTMTSTSGHSGPPGVEAPLPAKLTPQLPELAAAAPTSDDWLWEIKFDGYRLLARIEGSKVQLVTRGGHDWASKMPGLVKALVALDLGTAWLDGEIVVLGTDGKPSFNSLQNAIDNPRRADAVIDFFVFDAPYLRGRDLRRVPLVVRRQLLEEALEANPQEHVRYSAAFQAAAVDILESTRRMGLEGAMAKRKDSFYESRRTATWLKVKNRRRQEFVIVGLRDRSSEESEIGSLVLAEYDAQGQLRYVGRTGAGWDARTSADLRKQLLKHEVTESPFGPGPLPGSPWTKREGALHWVQPKLVAEVEFGNWSADGQLVHSRFIALRADKPASEVRHETAVMPEGPVLAHDTDGSVVEGIQISHPERVVDPSTGVTKLDLVRYYASVAEWMLPHLKDRPCSLVRGTKGLEGELFYQKHLNEQPMAEVRELPADLWPEHAPLMEVPTARALVAAAQMNVIEFHTWNAVAKKIGKPDRVIFDLDPGEKVPWSHVQEAALLVRGMLTELKLQSWLKTSGGKGLHVVVPLTPRDDWDAVKDFSEAVVHHLAQVIPQRFVAKSGAGNRVGRIYVDYLRNRFSATTAAAFSVRSRPGLGVSMPVSWDELVKLQSGAHWTVRTARDRLSMLPSDPWEEFWACKQTLAAGIKALHAIRG